MNLADRLGPGWITVTLGGVEIPLGGTGQLVIRHGRDRVSDQPKASTLTGTVVVDALPALPVLGDEVLVELGPDTIDYLGLDAPAADAAGTRFAGVLTDLEATPTEGVQAGGFLKFAAVTRRANLARQPIPAGPWPAELDGARVDRILDLAAAAAGITVGLVDPGRVQLAAAAEPTGKALEVLEHTANQADALLVQTRDGAIHYQDRDHRSASADPAVQLSAANVLKGVSWRQSMGELVTAVAYLWGPDPGTLATYTSPPEVDRYGPIPGTDQPDRLDLVVEAEVRRKGRDLIGRRAVPRWRIERLPVELFRIVAAAQVAQLLQLEVSDLVELVGFPSTGPHVAARAWAEGWTESIGRRSWRLDLAVSDFALTATAPRWADVDPAVTWADVPPDLTWDGATAWHTFTPQGRWLDQPANLRWSTTDPALTWATY